jgi:hypothetical protein
MDLELEFQTFYLRITGCHRINFLQPHNCRSQEHFFFLKLFTSLRHCSYIFEYNNLFYTHARQTAYEKNISPFPHWEK